MKKRPFLQSLHILLPILLSLAFSRAFTMLARFLLPFIVKSNRDMATYYINNSKPMAVYIDAFVTILIGIIFFFMYKKESKDHRFSYDRFLPVFLLLGLSLSLFLNMFFDFVHLTNASEAYQNLVDIQYSVPLFAGIIIYGIIKPIEEELVYRGLFYSRLRESFPAYISIPVSSLIFGFLHGNLTQLVYAFLMGILLSFVKEKQKNLLPCIFIHALANTVIFTVSSVDLLYLYVFTLPTCLLTGIISLFSIIYIYVKIYSKGKFFPEKAGEPTAEMSSKEDEP